MHRARLDHLAPIQRKLKLVEIARKRRGACELFRSTRRPNSTLCGGGLTEVRAILLRRSSKSAELEIDLNVGPQVVLCARNGCCALVHATVPPSAHAPPSLGPLETMDEGLVLGSRPARCDRAKC